ncbi:phage head closure protein [Heyndrickxia coagulans]|uniref:phage head closure protein n=1 Tax=Heyndrickxia coagulans TaxID=1398 RepID=UPI001451652A|nr:phage head closure protein [Heyndrickxia coagulans]MED4492827.1 phage head closure protein [Heyndrickxia coagulans]MED4535006.1 phage head closure protein [Heyndrickxia coagulans]QJE31806.1 phage head closure protein [Heyndrickxia coagulans]
MALARVRETFNDGVLTYGAYKTIRTESRKVTGKQFVEQGRLFYREMSVRESDYLQFGAMGSTLDLKVKTPMPPALRKIDKDKLIVRIDGDDFNIITVDRDANYLYFYLHKVDGGDKNE